MGRTAMEEAYSAAVAILERAYRSRGLRADPAEHEVRELAERLGNTAFEFVARWDQALKRRGGPR